MSVVGTMKYLTIGNSTYEIPSSDGTVTSVGVSNATNGGLTVSGSPITTSGSISIGHSNVLTNAQTTQAVYPIKIDKNGHISEYGSAVTIPSDTKVAVNAVTSGSSYYPILGNGSTGDSNASSRQWDSTGFSYSGTNGTTIVTGSAKLTLGNSTASGTANNKQGQLVIYGSTAYAHTIQGAPTAARTLTLPNATGTIALTSDIPSSAASSTTGISISNHTTSNIGSASGWSAGSASTWEFEEVSIPNVTAAGSASTWTFEEKTIPNVTAAGSGSFTSGTFSGGSGSFSASVTDHVLSFSHTHTAATHGADSHTHTAPTIGTAIKVQSKSGGGNGTAPTIGTAIKVQSKKSGSNSTVPSLTVTSTAVVTGTSHTITDTGHTHTLS